MKKDSFSHSVYTHFLFKSTVSLWPNTVSIFLQHMLERATCLTSLYVLLHALESLSNRSVKGITVELVVGGLVLIGARKR